MGQSDSAIFCKPLIIVSGKGGTGKTTLALALAHRLASEGKKVWLVERGHGRGFAFGRLHFSLHSTLLDHTPREVTLPGSNVKVWCSKLDPSQSLKEYLLLRFPIKGFVELLFQNSLTAKFLAAIPGLPNLVLVGKIWHCLAQNLYDHVILDAPASGHLLPLVSSARTFTKLTLAGPLFQDASKIDSFLHNCDTTQILLCAMPEELVLKETKELKEQLEKWNFSPLIILNKKHISINGRIPPQQSEIKKIFSYFKNKETYEQKCLNDCPLPIAFTFPFYYPEEKVNLYQDFSKDMP